MRIHIKLLKKPEVLPPNSIPPNVFREHNEGMSTDWSKYSNPIETRERAKDPHSNGVIEMNVGGVRNIKPLKVKHEPLPENRAHTNVYGVKENKTRVRVLLSRISNWILNPK